MPPSPLVDGRQRQAMAVTRPSLEGVVLVSEGAHLGSADGCNGGDVPRRQLRAPCVDPVLDDGPERIHLPRFPGHQDARLRSRLHAAASSIRGRSRNPRRLSRACSGSIHHVLVAHGEHNAESPNATDAASTSRWSATQLSASAADESIPKGAERVGAGHRSAGLGRRRSVAGAGGHSTRAATTEGDWASSLRTSPRACERAHDGLKQVEPGGTSPAEIVATFAGSRSSDALAHERIT